jgi:DNA-binding response OmpR family regulator
MNQGIFMSTLQPTPKRILCVEDNPDLCELVAAILLEYQVTSASGVEEAWQKLAEMEFALVVLDYHLIDGDGVALCRRIREAGMQMPILFITSDDDLTEQRVREAGGQVLVPKRDPRFIDELLEAVEKLLGADPVAAVT